MRKRIFNKSFWILEGSGKDKKDKFFRSILYHMLQIIDRLKKEEKGVL